MPGPSNSNVRRKRKSRGKSQSNAPAQSQLITTTTAQELPIDHESKRPCTPTPSSLPCQLPDSNERSFSLDDHVPRAVEEVMFKQPFIHDPGNGPRVRIAKDFISSFFAEPPAFDVSFVPALPFGTMVTISNDRTHYVLNLRRKKFCKCFARYCQKKLLW